MQQQNESQQTYNLQAAVAYHKNIPGSKAAEYLQSRGIDPSGEAEKYRFGYVDDPRPGHERYQGMLSVPYIRVSALGKQTVASIRFRCILDHDHHGHGKYLTQAGDRPRLYNTPALSVQTDVIAVTEGELDAVTVSLCGTPAVGLPGAQSWQDYFSLPFRGYKQVLVLADGDEPGLQFANTVVKSLYNARAVILPPGTDANSLVVGGRKQALLDLLKG